MSQKLPCSMMGLHTPPVLSHLENISDRVSSLAALIHPDTDGRLEGPTLISMQPECRPSVPLGVSGLCF